MALANSNWIVGRSTFAQNGADQFLGDLVAADDRDGLVREHGRDPDVKDNGLRMPGEPIKPEPQLAYPDLERVRTGQHYVVNGLPSTGCLCCYGVPAKHGSDVAGKIAGGCTDSCRDAVTKSELLMCLTMTDGPSSLLPEGGDRYEGVQGAIQKNRRVGQDQEATGSEDGRVALPQGPGAKEEQDFARELGDGDKSAKGKGQSSVDHGRGTHGIHL
jgi:hypothetical protein